jgi:hypothetical protein
MHGPLIDDGAAPESGPFRPVICLATGPTVLPTAPAAERLSLADYVK